MTDADHMREAMRLAQKAAAVGEVPVGCVVVRDGVIVSEGYNMREMTQNAVRHAEITAIEQACERVGYWRLPDCTLYVTLEPCPMCAGAMINARMGRVVFGAYDPKAGACHSVLDLFAYPFNHRPACTGGVLEQENAALLTAFFQKLRKT